MNLTNAQFDVLFGILGEMGAKLTDMCGRPVLVIPIKNWGYAPVEGNEDMMQPHQDWVLVVEENGDTWIWDSWILEG